MILLCFVLTTESLPNSISKARNSLSLNTTVMKAKSIALVSYEHVIHVCSYFCFACFYEPETAKSYHLTLDVFYNFNESEVVV
jgi:hypothetical protein